ncbi:MAG: ABC transporter substrate-binding protein [Chloroflexi bacterium]|nr:ABC transporter substrate-binding protein [Chloroflexota bacterium]
MSKLRLTLACADYDRTQGLKDGSIQPEGIDLNYLTLAPTEIFWRMFRYEDFDASEVSLSSYLLERSRGMTRFVAIPVFPSRFFRHSGIFVNTDAGIERPEDLAGKRVGMPEYEVTAAVWTRGFLQHDHGVTPDQVLWFTGGVEQPGRKEKLSLRLPADVRVQPIPEGRTLSGMLESGELDALAVARTPSCFLRGSPKVRRLFPDYRTVEMEYYKRTGIFPIMHTLAIREEVYRNNRWVADSLYKAFCQAKEACYHRMIETGWSTYTLPWFGAELDASREVLGYDLWPYGLEPNRTTLEALAQYSYEQGLAETRPEIESLFAPSTLDEFRI